MTHPECVIFEPVTTNVSKMADTEKDSAKVTKPPPSLSPLCVTTNLQPLWISPETHHPEGWIIPHHWGPPPHTSPHTHAPSTTTTKLNAPSTSSSPSSPPHCYMPPTSPSFLAPLLCKDIAPLFSRLLFLLLTPSRSHHFSSSSSFRPALPYVSLSLSRPSLAFCHA